MKKKWIRFTVPAVSFALTALLASCGGEVELADGDADDGASLYGSHCASCHGNDGRGDSGNPSIIGVSDEELIDAVREGPGSMPEWSTSDLSSSDLADLKAYIETL